MTALATPTRLAVHRSRKLIPEFRLHRPRSAAEAVAMKAAAGPGAVYMAGGIDVVNRMKSGLQVTDVIHLGAVAELDDIEEAEDGLQVGALVTHDRLATSPLVKAQLPALAQTWPDVANIRIRCKGTIGGNIMAGDRPMTLRSPRSLPTHASTSSFPMVAHGSSRRHSPGVQHATHC